MIPTASASHGQPEVLRLFRKISGKKQVLVFLGPSGSGKTENALNFAAEYVRLTGNGVHYFGINQAEHRFRPFFRQGDLRTVQFTFPPTLTNCPLIAQGLSGALCGSGCCIIDVGGGTEGATMIGQFSEILARSSTQVFYTINPYRSFCTTGKQVLQQMEQILAAAGLPAATILCNPNLGPDTRAEDILRGYHRLRQLLFPHHTIKTISAAAHFFPMPWPDGIPLIPLHLYNCQTNYHKDQG